MVVQDALANFIDILPSMSDLMSSCRMNTVVETLALIIKKASALKDFNDEEELKKLLVCNNACWAVGEIANISPMTVKPF